MDITSGRGFFEDANAGALTPAIATNSAIKIVLTMYLSVIAPFFVDDMASTSLFICTR
jgi:hypothetical protein